VDNWGCGSNDSSFFYTGAIRQYVDIRFCQCGYSHELFSCFLAVWLRRINNARKQKAIALTCTILLVFSVASAVISYEGSLRQTDTLENIRGQLEGDLLYNYMHEPLVKTLGDFYSEENNESGIGALFISRYDSLITEEGVFEFGNKDEVQTLYLYIAESNADSVVVIGESTYLEGQNDDFSNYSGVNGRYQVQGILTSRGIDYERQN
jgi:hypothetical protein